MHVARATFLRSSPLLHRYGGPLGEMRLVAVMIGGCANLLPT